MDIYFSENPKLEREYEQVILRDNNSSSISNDTDYYMVDMEYAKNKSNTRFDLVGAKWLSTSQDKRKTDNLRLALIEVKYGDKALTGSSGIVAHIIKLKEYLNSGHLDSLYDDVEKKFNQLIELDLYKDISSDKVIKYNRNIKPEYIIILANHKPASTILKRELSKVIVHYSDVLDKVDIKICTSSNMGYGLYDCCMKELKL